MKPRVQRVKVRKKIPTAKPRAVNRDTVADAIRDAPALIIRAGPVGESTPLDPAIGPLKSKIVLTAETPVAGKRRRTRRSEVPFAVLGIIMGVGIVVVPSPPHVDCMVVVRREEVRISCFGKQASAALTVGVVGEGSSVAPGRGFVVVDVGAEGAI